MAGPHEPFAGAVPHLLAELGYLDLLLRRAVLVARARRLHTDGEAFRGLMVTEAEVDLLVDAPPFGEERHPAGSGIADLDARIERQRALIRERIAASTRRGVHLPLARLAERCGLSEAETDLLLVAIAPEIDTRYETIFAYLQNDVTRKRPGVAMALELICRSVDELIAARSALSAEAPLLQFRLVTLGHETYDQAPTLLRHFLKLDEAVLRFLIDQPPAVSAAVPRIVMPNDAPPELSVSAPTVASLDALVRALERTGLDQSIVQLTGADEAPLEDAATALGQALDRPLLFIDPAHMPAEAEANAVVRDALLLNALPVLPRRAADAALDAAERRFWARAGAAGIGVVVLGGADDGRPLPPEARLWRLPIEGPDFAARTALWDAATRGTVPDAGAARLADTFAFGPARIRQTVALAFTTAALRAPTLPAPAMQDLLAAGRTLATPNLQRFSVAVTPTVGWDDIVLPPDRKQQLRGVAARVANRAIVQRDWGFAADQSRGRGTAVLLSGPPGTGKTMAAEVLAQALALQLFQIDVSTVVSRYVGDAEKQLATIFAEAERGPCILFFDECDAIFGKRTEVKDAHDRYANTEVNFLLQRLERYEGIVLLATNFQKNIDEAFLRRLSDSIEFPFPDAEARAEIWRRQFPATAPLAPDVDFAALGAQFQLPGGNIRNAAVYAAYRAAELGGQGATIGMSEIVEGVRREYQKQGKLAVASLPAPARRHA